MTTVTPAEAAETFDALLVRVRAGEKISIADAGGQIARLMPPSQPVAKPATAPPKKRKARKERKLPTQAEYDAWFEEMRQSRERMKVEGEPMSELVIRMRREAPY